MNLLTPVVFRKVKERDTDRPRGIIDLDDSVLKNTSFTLCLKSASHYRNYNFENIVIDTMPVYHGYICTVKSYWLDGVFYEKENFYLPYFQIE